MEPKLADNGSVIQDLKGKHLVFYTNLFQGQGQKIFLKVAFFATPGFLTRLLG
jgi:hypothetical protein